MEMQNDTQGKKIGMWLFLYTEIMLFGGLFVLYAVYYSNFTADFIAGGKDLDTVLGTINTVILLISSFAVAASITAIRLKSLKTAMIMVVVAMGCGLIFLINKYFEWGHKIELGIYPNSEVLTGGEPGRNIFFGLYYTITGLHGVHIIIGLTLLLICLILLTKKKITPEKHILLENAGLYWHLVDLIWIFIFPLFYLIL